MQKISALQCSLLIAASFMGLGIFQFPREAIDFAGPDAAYAFLLDVIGALAILWMFLRIADRNATRPSSGRGTPLQRVGMVALSGLRIILHLFLAVAVTVNFGQIMRTFFLPGTPIWAIEASVVATAIYMAWYGTPPLARTIEVMFLPTILISVVIALLVLPEMRFNWSIWPTSQVVLFNTLSGAYHQFYIFIGLEVVILLYQEVRPAEHARARRAALGVVAAAGAFFGLGFVLIMGTEGPSALATMQWPGVSSLRLADASGLLINKLGLLVVVFWGLFVLAFLGVRFWAMSRVTSALGVGSSQRAYRWGVLGVATATMALAQPIHNVVVLVHLFQTWVLPSMMSYLLGFPALVGLMAGIRRLRGRPGSNSRSRSPS